MTGNSVFGRKGLSGGREWPIWEGLPLWAANGDCGWDF
jgi:hypothetical protein